MIRRYFLSSLASFIALLFWHKSVPASRRPFGAMMIAVVYNPLTGHFGRVFEYQHAGDFLSGHTHDFDHSVYVSIGPVEIDRDGVPVIFSSDSIAHMPARAKHKITARVDGAKTVCWFTVPKDLRDAKEADKWAE